MTRDNENSLGKTDVSENVWFDGGCNPSVESLSPIVESFVTRENESSLIKAEVSQNVCFDDGCNPSIESLVPIVESGMQASIVTESSFNDRVQNLDPSTLDPSTPRDILPSQFGSSVRICLLHLPSQAEISGEEVEEVEIPEEEVAEEEVDMSPIGVGEVFCQPTFSPDLSFSVLAGYKRRRFTSARGRESSPAVARDPDFRITEDKSARTDLEEHANGQSGVSNAKSDGSNGNDVGPLSRRMYKPRLTRFGLEAAQLAMQSLAQSAFLSAQGTEHAPVSYPNQA